MNNLINRFVREEAGQDIIEIATLCQRNEPVATQRVDTDIDSSEPRVAQGTRLIRQQRPIGRQ